MILLRSTAALAVIFSAMVLADCTVDIQETLSSLPENPFFGPFPDPCKRLDFPFSFPLINNFPRPVITSMLPFPFSKLECLSPETPTPEVAPETPPAEDPTN